MFMVSYQMCSRQHEQDVVALIASMLARGATRSGPELTALSAQSVEQAAAESISKLILKLLDEYAGLDQREFMSERAPALVTQIGRDEETLEGLFQVQHEKTKQQVHTLLRGGVESSAKTVKAPMMESNTDDIWSSIMAAPNDDVGNVDELERYPWNQVTISACRAVRRLVKDLPA